MERRIEEILLKSLDQQLSSEEQSLLNKAQEQNPEIKDELKAYQKLRSRLSEHRYHASAAFKKEVMARVIQPGINKALDFQESLFSTFKYFAYPGAAAILLLLGLFFYTEGNAYFELFDSSLWPSSDDITVAQLMNF